eukprot:Rmarinus@m.9625
MSAEQPLVVDLSMVSPQAQSQPIGISGGQSAEYHVQYGANPVVAHSQQHHHHSPNSPYMPSPATASPASSTKQKSKRKAPNREGPHICEACGEIHDGSYGSGRFCSASCARRVAAHTKWERVKMEQSSQSGTSPSSGAKLSTSPNGSSRRTSQPRSVTQVHFSQDVTTATSLAPPPVNVGMVASSYPPFGHQVILDPLKQTENRGRSMFRDQDLQTSSQMGQIPGAHHHQPVPPLVSHNLQARGPQPGLPESQGLTPGQAISASLASAAPPRSSPIPVIFNDAREVSMGMSASLPSRPTGHDYDVLYQDVVSGHFEGMKRSDTETDLLRMAEENIGSGANSGDEMNADEPMFDNSMDGMLEDCGMAMPMFGGFDMT